jgi:hypothetical protein
VQWELRVLPVHGVAVASANLQAHAPPPPHNRSLDARQGKIRADPGNFPQLVRLEEAYNSRPLCRKPGFLLPRP